MKIYREITLVNPQEVFGLFNHPKATFDYPLHNHPEYEINLIMRASGSRIVGDKVEKYKDCDLVLLGPYLNHTWDGDDTDLKKYPTTHTIVLQFEETLFDSELFSKSVFYPIKTMLAYSVRGIEFSGKTRVIVMKKLLQLVEKTGFEAVLSFLEILQIMATSEENRLIASAGYSSKIMSPESKRMDVVYAFILENFRKKITAQQVANIINMSESAFSHFFKKSTNRSFSKFLTDTRLGEACKLLLETQHSVSEICFQCGYTNLSNFNR
ncbi:MAG: AraC family transcriptional regulator, partial [Bacteroidota bacterium]